MEKIEYISIGKIKPYDKNPREITDEAVNAVAASIKEFGFKQPIVVDSDMVIIVGHTRLKAAKKLGLKEVPVMVASDLTPDQVKAYRLADNKTNEFSLWDNNLLDSELSELLAIDFDMEQFGFDLPGEEEAEDTNEKEISNALTIAVEFEDEEEADIFYQRMKEEGYKCRVLTL